MKAWGIARSAAVRHGHRPGRHGDRQRLRRLHGRPHRAPAGDRRQRGAFGATTIAIGFTLKHRRHHRAALHRPTWHWRRPPSASTPDGGIHAFEVLHRGRDRHHRSPPLDVHTANRTVRQLVCCSTLGWRAMFWIGGALPLAYSFSLLARLPESPRLMARHSAQWPQLRPAGAHAAP